MKTIYLIVLAVAFQLTTLAQVDLTQLSLDINSKYNQNLGVLQNYTWNRNVVVSMNGEVKTTIQFSCSFSNGKQVSQETEKQSTVQQKPGVRGAIQKNEQSDMKEYVTNALNLVMNYIFLTKGQMVDLFDKGKISEINNTIQAEAFNLLTQGDHILFTYDNHTLLSTSQTISTLMDASDPVKCQVVYKTLENGLNIVESFTLTLPAKNLQVTATNSNYAKLL